MINHVPLPRLILKHARRPALVLALATCLMLIVAQAAFAGTTSRIISFEISDAQRLEVNGIDSSGLVAGSYTDSNSVSHGFTRDALGNITTFDAPGAGTSANQGTGFIGVSPSGYLCGYYITVDYIEFGFLLLPSGEFFQINVPGSTSTFATSVNDAGQVVGGYSSSSGSYGFVWTSTGEVVSFQPVTGGETIWARVNSAGDIAGLYWGEVVAVDRGYYRDATGNFATFVGSPTEASLVSVDLNDIGTLVGQFMEYNRGIIITHGFIGEAAAITQIDVPGAFSTAMTGINDAGTGVGYYQDTRGAFHSFIRDQAGNFTYFNGPGAGNLPDQGTYAIAINSAGAVAGTYTDSGNGYHGFVRK